MHTKMSMLFVIVMAFAIMGVSEWGRCDQPLPRVTDDGFTADTSLNLSLVNYSIYRPGWYLLYGNCVMSSVTLSQGHGTTGNPNKIMIYGDRTGQLLSGEPDWALAPRPINLFFTPTQISISYTLDFGPQNVDPDIETWHQYYLYTACCNRVSGDSTSSSKTLSVENNY